MAQLIVATAIPYEGLTSELGYWLWNVLMTGIPYDTGNLRSSFKLKSNGSRKISFIFDDSEAYYVDYLEEGIGFVTKHKDFIKKGLVGLTLQELIYFIKTGKTGLITSKPTVVMRESRYSSPIGYERKILKQMNSHINYINAKERGVLSKIKFKQEWGAYEQRLMGGRTPRILKEFKGNGSLDVQPLSLPTERNNMVVEFGGKHHVY